MVSLPSVLTSWREEIDRLGTQRGSQTLSIVYELVLLGTIPVEYLLLIDGFTRTCGERGAKTDQYLGTFPDGDANEYVGMCFRYEFEFSDTIASRHRRARTLGGAEQRRALAEAGLLRDTALLSQEIEDELRAQDEFTKTYVERTVDLIAEHSRWPEPRRRLYATHVATQAGRVMAEVVAGHNVLADREVALSAATEPSSSA